jgi:hypothetical protein
MPPGHRGKFGHEFLEFEFRPDGEVRAGAPLNATAARGKGRGHARQNGCGRQRRRPWQQEQQLQRQQVPKAPQPPGPLGLTYPGRPPASARHPRPPPPHTHELARAIPPPQLRYRNNSHYKYDTEIRKRAFVSQAVLDELKRIIDDSEVGGAGGGWGGGVGRGEGAMNKPGLRPGLESKPGKE